MIYLFTIQLMPNAGDISDNFVKRKESKMSEKINFYDGMNYSCIYCGSLFNGECCPNCGATEYKLSPGRLAWEETQRRAVQEAREERLHEERKWQAKENMNKTNRRTHLAIVIAFLVVFVLIWVIQFISMSARFSMFSSFY